MGSLHGIEYAGMVARDELRLDAALMSHLRGNHFPPIPSEMIGPAKKAIEAANEGERDRIIPLPDGIEHRSGATEVPASSLIEYMHLGCFTGGEDEDAPGGNTAEDIPVSPPAG